jgi:RNA 2',3'-cyclic 3'-phosphodiesterase
MEMEQQTHFFFAVKIPEQTKIWMKEVMETLKPILPFKRWVHHEDLHITLAFLGFAPSDKLMKAITNVEDSLNGVKSLILEFNGLGIFGSLQSPRIFWADTKESQVLQLVRNKVFTACSDAGFQLETRPFRPHITLARKWAGEEPFHKGMLEIWENLKPKSMVFETNEVVLYQTHLHKTPKYEIKEVFLLNH